MRKYVFTLLALLLSFCPAQAQVATSIPYGVRLPVVDFSFNTYLSDPGPLNFPTYAVMFKDAAGVWRMRTFLVDGKSEVKTNSEYVSNANWNYAAGASLQMTKVSGGAEWPQTVLVFRRDK